MTNDQGPMTNERASMRHPSRGAMRVVLLLLWSLVISHWSFFFPCPCQAASPWIDERFVGVFVCRSEFPLEEIAPLLAELDQLQLDLIRTLGIPKAAESVELCLFQDKASYEAFLARYYPQVPYRRALYIKMGGLGRVLAHRGPEFETDVRHESTHGLLHAALPLVPLWLDEGLAEYFEISRNRRAFDNSYLGSMRQTVWLGQVPGLAYLERKERLEETGRDDYRNAWAWVHFLLHGSSEGHAELVRYLADLRNTDPPGPMSQRLRARLPKLEEQFASHFRSWQRRAENDAAPAVSSRTPPRPASISR